jgi:hypothetical protein
VGGMPAQSWVLFLMGAALLIYFIAYANSPRAGK